MNDVVRSFQRRIAENMKIFDHEPSLIETAANICMKTIHSLFIDHGMKLAILLNDESTALELKTVTEKLKDQFSEELISKQEKNLIYMSCLHCLNGALFNSAYQERMYFGQLSRTYITMFLVQNEPKIVEYFKTMSSNFTLYIGSDIIIRCISEHNLDSANQPTINALRMLSQNGSKLILSELVLDEVWNHILGTHYEYMNHYLDKSDHITLDDAVLIDRILIRTYFMTKLQSDKKTIQNISWKQFLNQFSKVPDIQQEVSQKRYTRVILQDYLNLEYETCHDMSENLDQKQISDLANKIYNVRKRKGRYEEVERKLCQNSAMTILRVYEKRTAASEQSLSPFGFNTWWLSGQTRLFPATLDLVKQKGSRYMIRFEFILNYLLSNPEFSQIAKSYNLIFPTILGIQLSKHIDEEVYKAVVDNMHEVHDIEHLAQTKAELGELTNELVSDFEKEY